MRKFKFFTAMILMAMVFSNCQDSSDDIAVQSGEQFIAERHQYEDNSGATPILGFEFKLLNDAGISHYSLNVGALKPNEQYAIMQVYAPKEKSSQIVFSNGLELYDDGRHFDASPGDGIFTAIQIVRYQPKGDLISSRDATNRKIKIGVTCAIDVISTGENCYNEEDKDYTCDAWIGYCYCIYDCEVSFEIEF